MSRVLALAAATAAIAAVLAVPEPGDPGAVPEDAVLEEVTSTVLACPALALAPGSVAAVGGLVAEGLPGDRPGSAGLRLLDSTDDLARVPSPGSPVHLLFAGKSRPPVLMQARGAWATSALAGVAVREADPLGLDAGARPGISSTACFAPAAQWWFVGSGSQAGRDATLLVANPAQEPARFDINLHGRTGAIPALASRGIDVAPESHVRLRLEALAPDEPLLAVHVQATNGRVTAALRDVLAPRGDEGRGADFIPPAQPPGNDLVIAGVPGGAGSRELVLVNPGTHFATVTPRLLGAGGRSQIEGLGTVAVPAGSVVSVDLDRVLGGRAGSLHLASDTAVTGGVRSSWGTVRREFMWLAATPRVDAGAPLAGAVVVPGGAGLTTTVTIAAPEGTVQGTLSSATAGSAADSIVGSASDAAGSTGAVLPAGAAVDRLQVVVPAGTQRTLTVSGTAAVAAASLSWLSDSGSGPALVSHVTLDERAALATGYQWWPATSYVPIVGVREDIGTLIAGETP